MAGLTERERELAMLTGRVERLTAARRGGAVVVAGPPGVGKTTLLDATAAAAEAAGAAVVRVVGREIESPLALGLVERLVDALPDAVGGVPAGPAAAAAPLDEGELDPGRIAPRISELLEGAVAERPLLACVDDLQWADRASLDVLGWLLEEWAEELPLLFVAGLRDADGGGPLAERLAALGATVVRPRPLTVAGVGALLADHGLRPTAAELDGFVARSGGIPFLVVALARQRLEGADADDVPLSVQEAVGRRLAALDRDALRTARALAVLDGAPPAVAAAVLDRPPEAVAAATERLRGRGLLGDDGGFEHPLVREAVLAAIPASARSLLHGRAAQALLAAGDRRAAAVHALAAAPTGSEPLVRALGDEAAVARREGDPEHAVRLLRRAIEEPAPRDRLGDLLRELAELLIELGRFDDAIATARRLHGLDRGGDGPESLAAELLEARALTVSGRSRQAMDRLRAVLRGPAARDPHRRLEAEVLLTTAAAVTFPAFGGWTPDEITAYDEAYAIEPLLAWSTLSMRARYEYLARGDREAILELSRQGATPPPDVPLTPIVTVQLSVAATGMVACGAAREALSLLEPLLTRARASSSRMAVALLLVGHATACLALGDLRRCEEEVTEFRGLPGAPRWDAIMLPLLSQCLREQGRFEEAAAAVVPVLDASDPQHRLRALHADAELRLARGDDAAALAGFLALGEEERRDPALAVPIRTWRGGAAVALLRLGRTGEARRLAQEHLEHAQRWGGGALLGEAHRVLGEVTGDAALVERGLPALRDAELRLEHAHGLLVAGRLHRRAGRRGVAADRFEHVLRAARWCGAHALAEQAAAELAVLRSRPRALAFSGLDALTAAERRVARLAADGLRSEEIARQLYVSRRTVENHLGRTYQKLGVRGREELRSRMAVDAVA
ncbi:AAA family ATPase [Patulibacter defluvii]|uniref:AAA family ATPase n=1 Tax=Patulibacter defluvii TaxID=3095358 RepID=UPI002A75288B|nr:AAA family ATPase [Patulibacter sp. DM4]